MIRRCRWSLPGFRPRPFPMYERKATVRRRIRTDCTIATDRMSAPVSAASARACVSPSGVAPEQRRERVPTMHEAQVEHDGEGDAGHGDRQDHEVDRPGGHARQRLGRNGAAERDAENDEDDLRQHTRDVDRPLGQRPAADRKDRPGEPACRDAEGREPPRRPQPPPRSRPGGAAHGDRARAASRQVPV